MSDQIAIRIPERLTKALTSSWLRAGSTRRPKAVRSAVEALVEAERRRLIGEEIADGYRRIPQEEDEIAAATEAAIRSIHEEPW